MTMKAIRNSIFAASSCSSLFIAPALAQHADVSITVVNGRLTTGGYDHETGEETPVQRVFGYDFGEDPLDPYFAGDPGFNAPHGSLPAGSQLRFDVPSATQAVLPWNLSYWDGQGTVNFSAAPSGESVLMSLGSQSLSMTGTGTGPLAGFPLGTVGSGGSMHRHLNTFLMGSDGNNTAGDGIEPAPGIYAFPMELGSSDASILSSQTFYMVFNNGLSEVAHARAIDQIQSNIIPEPATGSLAVVAAGLLLRRRRQLRQVATPFGIFGELVRRNHPTPIPDCAVINTARPERQTRDCET